MSFGHQKYHPAKDFPIPTAGLSHLTPSLLFNGLSSLSDRNPRGGDGASIWILPTTNSLIHFVAASLIVAWLLDFGFGWSFFRRRWRSAMKTKCVFFFFGFEGDIFFFCDFAGVFLVVSRKVEPRWSTLDKYLKWSLLIGFRYLLARCILRQGLEVYFKMDNNCFLSSANIRSWERRERIET